MTPEPLQPATRESHARASPSCLLVAAVSIGSLPLIAIAFIWLNTERAERRLFIIALFSLIVLAGLAGVYWLFSRARQATIVRLANNHPLTFDQVARQPYALAEASLDGYYAAQLAEASREHPALTSLHYNYQPHTESHATLPTPDAAAATGLEAVPVAEWLDWIDKEPHVILAAQTGRKESGQGGKSTMAKAILAMRVARSEHILPLDPHASQWFDLPVVGGGQQWTEITTAITGVTREYFDRMQERRRHLEQTGQELPHDHFPRLTVLLDEAFEARQFLDRKEKRGDLSTWEYFTEVLGSGARKVSISVILLTQTANVEDLGLSGSARNNFTCIALDDRTIKLLVTQEEKDPKRREQLYQALIGRRFPAAMLRGSQVHLLDRTGLDTLPPPASAASCFWAGWNAPQQLPDTTPPPEPRRAALTEPLPQLTLEDEIVLLLRQWRQRVTARQIADAMGRDVKVIRTVLKTMTDQGRLERANTSSGYEYFVDDSQSINQPTS